MIKTLLTIMAVIAACIAVYGIGIAIDMKTAKAGESWKMKIHYTLTDERYCAYHVYDTKKSCEAAKDWFVGLAAARGKNKYQCILESQCP